MRADLAPYLDEAQQQWRDTVHAFLQRHCPPDYVRTCDEEKRFPEELVRQIAEAGWFGVTVPEAYGGTGSYLEMAAMVEMMAYHSIALARLWNITVNMVGGAVSRFASDDVKAELLPRVAEGRTLFAFALSENNAGSDAAALTTRAAVDGERAVINGTKMWISGALTADYILTACRTDPNETRHKGISLFLVPRDAPGVTVRPIDLLGGHALRTCEVDYEDVAVPVRLMVGELHTGWLSLMRVLAKERLSLACMCVGGAQAAIDLAVDYTTQRKQFGRPISTFQANSQKLVELQTRVDAARMLAYRAARLLADGQPCDMESSQAKFFAADTYVQTGVEGVQLMGANGYSAEYAMQRHLRESKLFQIFGGTNEIQRSIVAGHMGLTKSA